MGVSRLAPHRVRAKYARALAEIPLPVRSITGIEPDALDVLAEVEVADRLLRFGVLAGTPRLWVTVDGHMPPMLGYLTSLDTRSPELHVTERDHLEWTRHSGRAARIEREALRIWDAAQRECEG